MNFPQPLRMRTLNLFLLLVLIVTIIMGTIYVAVQQSYRMNANDPQIEASEAVVNLLNQGIPGESLVNVDDAIDITNNLSPFIMIFDKDKKLVASSGKIGESTPTPPNGVFDAAAKHNDDRFTWQPQKGVRIAAVVKKASDDKGYVLVGRNLREVESRVYELTLMIAIAWGMLLILSALLAAILSRLTGPSLAIVEETNVVVESPETKSEEMM